MNPLIIFTDGASRGNPGAGGWGAIVASSDTVTELGGREANTTNNRMELQGLIQALEHVVSNSFTEKQITVFTDSRYVIRGVEEWLRVWQVGGWKTKAKKEVLNRDLWEKLADLVPRVKNNFELKFEYVGGHVGIPGNERVDQIATESADGEKPKLYSGPKSAYKIDISKLDGDNEKTQEKSQKKSRNDKPAYSYISMVDGIIQIHKTWAECEKRVKGVSKTKFQKVFSKEEEQEVIERYSETFTKEK